MVVVMFYLFDDLYNFVKYNFVIVTVSRWDQQTVLMQQQQQQMLAQSSHPETDISNRILILATPLKVKTELELKAYIDKDEVQVWIVICC
jgi:hypothetical protein